MLYQSADLIKDLLDWKACLDIFFITTAIFFTYQTLRRLGTWKIALGIIAALSVFIVANILDLEGVRWLYSNLSKVALIALIVIFQPEIRRLLERAVSLKGNEMAFGESSLLQLVSDSVFTLAEQRRGAILVFPGRESTKQWAFGGFPLQAQPTFPLIMSIFDPHSPGHDGAIIIENEIISLFGVRLPLSKTNTLSNQLGTRHHAAMGLSEVSDAFVVVVSEERGSVTTFQNGQMKITPNKSEFSAKLMSHFKKSSSYLLRNREGKGKRHLATGIALSTLSAFVFWAGIAMYTAEMLERGFLVPVKYIVPSNDIALVGDKPTEAKLQLAGSKADLDRISLSQLAVKIDLSKAMPGKQVIVVSDENVELPKSIKLLEVEPSNFVLNLQQVLETEATVVPQMVGKIAGGLKVASVDINPPKVRVLGPTDKLKQKKISVMTTPIYLESIKENTTLFCKIIAPPGIRPVESRWPDIEVSITLRSQE